MKKIFLLTLCIFLLSSVSAYSHCENRGGTQWCCNDAGAVICQPGGDICGISAFCDSYNNNAAKACATIGGQIRCCTGAYVIDATANLCCPTNQPYYLGNNACGPLPSDVSNNWYTQQSSCKGFIGVSGFGLDMWNPVARNYAGNGAITTEEQAIPNVLSFQYSLQMGYYQCQGNNLYMCSQNPVGTLIFAYRNFGARTGACGVQCITDTCTNTIYNQCQNYQLVPQGEVPGKCGVSCIEGQIYQQGTQFFDCSGGVLINITDVVILTHQQQTDLINQINGLNASVQEKVALIDNLTTTLNGEILLIDQLNASIQEKAQIIQALQLNLDDQARVIASLQLRDAENVQIIQALNLNIQQQADMINQLTANLQEKAYYISQLQAENENQAALIAAMQLSFTNQAGIIQNLNHTIVDDGTIIRNLNYTVSQQADLVSQLTTNLQEKEQLIGQLNLDLQQQIDLVSQLNIQVADEEQIIKQLNNKITLEQSTIDQLQAKTLQYQQTNNLLNNILIYILWGVAILAVIIILIFALRGKKKRKKY